MNNNVLKLILCTGIFCGTNFGMYQDASDEEIDDRPFCCAQLFCDTSFGTYQDPCDIQIDYRPYIPMGKDEDWGKNLKARRQRWQRDISEYNNRIINEKILLGYGMICFSPFVLCYLGLSKLYYLCPVRNR